MALQKELIDSRGIVSRYHRIANIQQNFINHEPILEIYLYHYSDIGYRSAEKVEILENIDFQNIVGTSVHRLIVDESKGATRSDIYQRLKTEVPEFEGSVDI